MLKKILERVGLAFGFICLALLIYNALIIRVFKPESSGIVLSIIIISAIVMIVCLVVDSCVDGR